MTRHGIPESKVDGGPHTPTIDRPADVATDNSARPDTPLNPYGVCSCGYSFGHGNVGEDKRHRGYLLTDLKTVGEWPSPEDLTTLHEDLLGFPELQHFTKMSREKYTPLIGDCIDGWLAIAGKFQQWMSGHDPDQSGDYSGSDCDGSYSDEEGRAALPSSDWVHTVNTVRRRLLNVRGAHHQSLEAAWEADRAAGNNTAGVARQYLVMEHQDPQVQEAFMGLAMAMQIASSGRLGPVSELECNVSGSDRHGGNSDRNVIDPQTAHLDHGVRCSMEARLMDVSINRGAPLGTLVNVLCGLGDRNDPPLREMTEDQQSVRIVRMLRAFEENGCATTAVASTRSSLDPSTMLEFMPGQIHGGPGSSGAQRGRLFWAGLNDWVGLHGGDADTQFSDVAVIFCNRFPGQFQSMNDMRPSLTGERVIELYPVTKRVEQRTRNVGATRMHMTRRPLQSSAFHEHTKDAFLAAQRAEAAESRVHFLNADVTAGIPSYTNRPGLYLGRLTVAPDLRPWCPSSNGQMRLAVYVRFPYRECQVHEMATSMGGDWAKMPAAVATPDPVLLRVPPAFDQPIRHNTGWTVTAPGTNRLGSSWSNSLANFTIYKHGRMHQCLSSATRVTNYTSIDSCTRGAVFSPERSCAAANRPTRDMTSTGWH